MGFINCNNTRYILKGEITMEKKNNDVIEKMKELYKDKNVNPRFWEGLERITNQYDEALKDLAKR
ncbi:hypothetical protein [Bacillus phage YungSlug]|nr:hypothetical protein [Bacillus phage YungSlug]